MRYFVPYVVLLKGRGRGKGRVTNECGRQQGCLGVCCWLAVSKAKNPSNCRNCSRKLNKKMCRLKFCIVIKNLLVSIMSYLSNGPYMISCHERRLELIDLTIRPRMVSFLDSIPEGCR